MGLSIRQTVLLLLSLEACDSATLPLERSFEIHATGYQFDSIPGRASFCHIYATFPRAEFPAQDWTDGGRVFLDRQLYRPSAGALTVDSVIENVTLTGHRLALDSVRLELGTNPPLVLLGHLSAQARAPQFMGTWSCESDFPIAPDSSQQAEGYLIGTPLVGDWSYQATPVIIED